MWYKSPLWYQLIEYFIILEKYGDLIRLWLINNESVIEWHKVTIVVSVLGILLWTAIWSDQHPHAHCILPTCVFGRPSHVNTYCRYFLRLSKFMEQLRFIEGWTDVIRTIVTALGILNSCSILASYINTVHAVIILEERSLSKSIVCKNLAVPWEKLIFQN